MKTFQTFDISAAYDDIHRTFPCYKKAPVIGLTGNFRDGDGILLTGGADINPLFMDEEPVKELHSINPHRDRQELLLTKLAADRQIPILGICRGIQMMNAALGGSLYQDIHSQMEGTRIKHDQDLERSYATPSV